MEHIPDITITSWALSIIVMFYIVYKKGKHN